MRKNSVRFVDLYLQEREIIINPRVLLEDLISIEKPFHLGNLFFKDEFYFVFLHQKIRDIEAYGFKSKEMFDLFIKGKLIPIPMPNDELGVYFYFNKKDVNYDVLINDFILIRTEGDFRIYKYKTTNNIIVEYDLEFEFYKNIKEARMFNEELYLST